MGVSPTAVSMLEAVDQVAQERSRNVPLYRMLVGALRTLAADPSPVVSAAFFWKLLSLEGFHPVLECCARCSGPLEPDRSTLAFDLGDGGVLCLACGRLGGRQVGAAAAAVVALMVGDRCARCSRRHRRRRCWPRWSAWASRRWSTTRSVASAAPRSCSQGVHQGDQGRSAAPGYHPRSHVET